MLFRTGLLAILLTAALAQPANALTRFVDCEGDSTALRDAVNASASGDVLVVTTNGCWGTTISGKDLMVMGFFTFTPTISGATNFSPAIGVHDANVALVNLNLRADGGCTDSDGLRVYGGATATAAHLKVSGADGPCDPRFFVGSDGIEVHEGGSLTMEDSTVHRNHYVSLRNAGEVTLRRVSVVDNTKNAIVNRGQMRIEDSTVARNKGLSGGGVQNHGSLEMVRSTVSENEALFVGGGISNAGQLTLSQSSVIDNRAFFSLEGESPAGGGLSTGPGSRTNIHSSTFSGNSAEVGGAIWNDDAEIDIKASTISGNTAEAGASAVAGTTGTIWTESSVITGVLSRAGATSCTGQMTWASFGGNVLSLDCGPASPGPGDQRTDVAGLDGPANNGGPTVTMRPRGGSPVIARGRCVFSHDQRGVPRPAGGCDAGAYENRPPSTPDAPALSNSATPNRGDYTLDWPNVTDPDSDFVSYQLFDVAFGSSDGAALGGLLSDSSRRLLGVAEGSRRYFVTATDGREPSPPSARSTLVVVDRTAPPAPSITLDRTAEWIDAAGESWFADTVTADVAPGTDPVLADGSEGSGTIAPAAGERNFDAAGHHEISEKSVDAAANESAVTTLAFNVDGTSPEVAFDACPARAAFGSAVEVDWRASDTGSGLAGAASGTLPLDVSQVGGRSVQVEVRDQVGHVATATCAYEVTYAFSGFEAPLKAAFPSLNTVTSGQATPVRFALGGNAGLDVLEGAPQVVPISCTTREATGSAVNAVAQRPLSYDAAKRQYTYWWLPPKEWRKTCAQLVVAFDDGTAQRANVSFR